MKCVQDKKDATREHQLWHTLLVVRKELIDFQPETKPLTALRLPAAEEGLVTAPSPYCLTQDQNLNKTVALDSFFKYTIFSWVSSNLRSLTQSHSRPCSWSLRSCLVHVPLSCLIIAAFFGHLFSLLYQEAHMGILSSGCGIIRVELLHWNPEPTSLKGGRGRNILCNGDTMVCKCKKS